MSTAVWMVMCRHPAMRAPASGRSAPYSSRSAIRPGISVSAMAISFRPHPASARFPTLKSPSFVMARASSFMAPSRLRPRTRS